jgi:Helix-turn-helix domain
VITGTDGRPGIAEELRRRRTALGWTLEQVAAQAQVSVGMLSLIETGKRRPSLRSGSEERWVSVSHCPRGPGASSRGRSRMSWWRRWAPAWPRFVKPRWRSSRRRPA